MDIYTVMYCNTTYLGRRLARKYDAGRCLAYLPLKPNPSIVGSMGSLRPWLSAFGLGSQYQCLIATFSSS